MKKALITGITGQDGIYLSKFLINKGYEVHGIQHYDADLNSRIGDRLFNDKKTETQNFTPHNCDLTDSTLLIQIIKQIQPDEIYNLLAPSDIKASCKAPEYTGNIFALGTTRLLEAIRKLGLSEKTKFFNASPPDLYETSQNPQQTEKSPFYPTTPHAIEKLYAHWMTVHYRETHKLYACNGILFNHVSPLQDEECQIRKITRSVAKIALGLQRKLYLESLDAQRDCGHTADYVKVIWLMLQQSHPEDFVIASGESTSVREFVRIAFSEVGVELSFDGEGPEEVGIVVGSYHPDYPVQTGATIVHIDQKNYSSTENNYLVGNSEKARSKLGWQPKYGLKSIIREMLAFDLELLKKKQELLREDFTDLELGN